MTSQHEKEESDLLKMKKTLLVMLREKDADGSGNISEEEMMHVLKDPDAQAVLESLDVDIEHAMDVGSLIHERFEFVSISMTMELLLASRGGRHLTMKDLCNMSQFLYWKLERRFDLIEEAFALERRSLKEVLNIQRKLDGP